VNIDGLHVDVIGGKAVISMEVKDPKKADDILIRNGFKTTDPTAIVIKISNTSMEKITEMLELEKVTIKGLSKLSSDSNEGIFAINVDKPRKATKMLSPFLLGNQEAPY